MLVLEEVCLGYGPIRAVRGLSMEVRDGAAVALLGRNGAGKTTTLAGVAGVLTPTDGTIVFDGKRLNSCSPAEVLRLGIAYVPEGRGILGSLSVSENMACAAYGAGLGRRRGHQEARLRLGVFPVLESRLNQKAGSLSGGEQQMLAVARALVSRPKLLLVDEPSLGLAPIIVSALYAELARVKREEGIAVLLVEQYVDLALRSADAVVVLEKGEQAYASSGPNLVRDLDQVAAHIS